MFMLNKKTLPLTARIELVIKFIVIQSVAAGVTVVLAIICSLHAEASMNLFLSLSIGGFLYQYALLSKSHRDARLRDSLFKHGIQAKRIKKQYYGYYRTAYTNGSLDVFKLYIVEDTEKKTRIVGITLGNSPRVIEFNDFNGVCSF